MTFGTTESSFGTRQTDLHGTVRVRHLKTAHWDEFSGSRTEFGRPRSPFYAGGPSIRIERNNMTPEQHAVEWWGDDSYPKGQDWDALLAQFAKCRDEARNAALDDAIARLDQLEPFDKEAMRAQLQQLKDQG